MSLLPSTIHLHDSSLRPAKRIYVIYFIPGNPGLTAYYTTFLTHLYGLLKAKYASSSEDVDFQVYGRSLSGFEVQAWSLQQRYGKAPPYDVNEQIEHTIRDLKFVVRSVKANGKSKDVRVILMGHSLGTYLGLEVLRRLREEASGGGEEGVRVAGTVMLFATILHLAKSPRGLSASGILAIPNLDLFVSFFAKGLTLFLPMFVLTKLIQLALGFPADGARVTAEFLKSPYGVRQALYMAKDEMEQLSIDKWDDEVWGAAHSSSHPHPRPTLRFLFAKTDHWIANETRDELMKARGSTGASGEKWKPKMEVDEEEGWTHDFCIHQSVPVAERACGYVEDIVNQDLHT